MAEWLIALSTTLLGGVGVYFITRVFDQKGIIPGRYNPGKGKVDYTHLSGNWYLYYQSLLPRIHPTPIWIEGKQELVVNKKGLIKGFTSIPSHPSSQITYKLHGEIRSGKMFITDYCLQDETEFASMIYQNLVNTRCLLGVWTGLDGNNHLIAAPTILIREEATISHLNHLVKQSTLNIMKSSKLVQVLLKNGKLIQDDL